VTPPKNKRTRVDSTAEAESPKPPIARGASVRPAPDSKAKPTGESPLKRKLATTVAVLKTVLGIVAVVGASVGVAWGAKRYMMTSPRFSVKTIAVEGNTRLSPEDVARTGGIAVGDNVFALDLDETRRKVEADPWVKNASVARKLPGSVVVKLVEHEPAAVVAIGDRLFLASRAGEVFKEIGAEDPLDFPVITGLEPEAAAADREGTEKRVVKALDLLDEVAKASFAARYPVQEVHLEKDGTLSLVVGRQAIVVALGHPPYKGKLEQADRVFLELGKRKAEAEIVFLDNEGSPERVVVRMR
jgi:cell division protein FtsQ